MKRQREDSPETEKEFVCMRCSKRFKRCSYLRQHMQIHKPKQKCEKCGKLFSFSSNLKAHEKSAHGISSARSDVKVSNAATPVQCRNSYQCIHCDRAYETYNQLVDHVVDNHPLNQHGGRQVTPARTLPDISNRNDSQDNKPTAAMQNQIQDETALTRNVQNRNIYPKHGEKYDPLTFFANVRERVLDFLASRTRQLGGIKWNLCVQVEMQRDDGEDVKSITPYFRSVTYQLLAAEDLNDHDLNEAMQKMYASLEKFIRESSAWYVNKVLKLEIHTVVYKPISGSSYLPLPKTLAHSRSVLNIQNDDNKCFLYCILASLHPSDTFSDISQTYQCYEHELNMKGIHYPVVLPDVRTFERQNEHISINVFTFENGSILPLRVTSHTKRLHHVNLLSLKNTDTSHYCLITDLNRFLSRSKTVKNKSYFCPYCLHGFIREDLLRAHQPSCSTRGPQKVELPTPGKDDILKFKEYEKTLKVPFVIYADFETVNIKLHTCAPDPKLSANTQTSKLEVCGFAYKVVCEDHRFTKSTIVYRGPDAATKLIERLLMEQEHIQDILSHVQPMPDHVGLIENAERCCLCKKPFTPYDRTHRRIVAHHNHLTGQIIGPACNNCNLNCKQAKFTCVFFHNLRNFDAHILCETLGRFKEHRMTCIAQNSERYISFTLGGLRFLDSYQFLTSSLETLVNDLKQDGLKAFPLMFSEFQSQERVEMMARKGTYPYDYMDSLERFEEHHLPPKEDFYSCLTKENISDEEYEHAQNVFTEFNMKTLGDYHDLYVKTDVLLLADVFESFRSVCMTQYQLDPSHFYTAAGLAWASLLKMTGVELELITSISQILMIEDGIRGGLSQISNRYKKANNHYLDDYDPSEQTSFLLYLDANNLYGAAMREPLPVGGFRFLDKPETLDVMAIPERGDFGYILEVSLHYPEKLHDLHNCLPLAPERKIITNDQLSPYAKRLLRNLRGLKQNDPLPTGGRVAKLLATLEDKNHYVVHYRNLQLYIRLGMEIKTIHRVLQFKQKAWMKPYIDFNTEKRKHASSAFQKSFYKLMNVSVFGKTMENVRKHKDIELIHREERLKKVVAKPSYKNTTIFKEDLVAVELQRLRVTLNKPSYSGFSILDISKTIMYSFWYDYVKPRYGDKAQLHMTDTDSLLFSCQTEDIYNDMLTNIDMFDTSDYPVSHPLHSNCNRKALGKMKDETKGAPISEFAGLRSKLYSFVCNRKEEKRAKGVSKNTVRKDIRHEHYKDVLFRGGKRLVSMTSIRSHKHELFCERINKIGLSAFDDKRYLKNSIDSYAYGHYKINDDEKANACDNEVVEILPEQTFILGDYVVTPCVSK